MDGGYEVRDLARHLLKFYGILDVSAGKLPRLEWIGLGVHTYVWGEPFSTRVRPSYEDGVLRVKMSDVEIPYFHNFQNMICIKF